MCHCRWATTHGSRWTASGRSNCSPRLIRYRRGRSPARRLEADGPSPSRATGPCRTSATCRTTRTCRCRSPVRRRGCPTATPPACTDGPSRPAAGGSAIASCCTSAAPRASTPCTSTVASSGTAPTVVCPASTTSPTPWCRARITWRSSSSATAHSATWRTRTSGGWPACTAACTSRRVHRCTSPTSCATRISTCPRATGGCVSPHRWASRSSPDLATRPASPSSMRRAAGSADRRSNRSRTASRSRTCSPASNPVMSSRCPRSLRGPPRHPRAIASTSI